MLVTARMNSVAGSVCRILLNVNYFCPSFARCSDRSLSAFWRAYDDAG